jgi:hypothetical protein
MSPSTAKNGGPDHGAPEPGQPSPEEQLLALYEQAESRTAEAFEEMVATRGFGWLFARSAENIAAVVRISNDVADLVLRNLRLAGRADIVRLARQLHRTEDKLERVLQEVEALRDEVRRDRSGEDLRGDLLRERSEEGLAS